SLGEQLIERRAALQPLAELTGLRLQLRIGERLHARLERVGRPHELRVAADHSVVAAAENALEKLEQLGFPVSLLRAPRGLRRGGSAEIGHCTESTRPRPKGSPPRR